MSKQRKLCNPVVASDNLCPGCRILYYLQEISECLDEVAQEQPPARLTAEEMTEARKLLRSFTALVADYEIERQRVQ